MCCGSMMYPNALGIRIAELKPGDEVIILKGEGIPATQKETCTLIWKVDGYSALTIDGIALSCMSISDLIVTGNQYQTYEVTAEAMQIWGEIVAERHANGDDQEATEPDWTVPPPFPNEPE